MHAFLQDIRYSIRQLRKSPGFALTAIATLGLGIGAVTSVFSVVHAVLLNPFAFHNPGQLVVVRETVQEMQKTYPELPDNYLHYTRLKADSKTLADAAIFQDNSVSISTGTDHPQIVGSLQVSSNFFSLLGVRPILGRTFTADETAVGRKRDVAILSYSAWQRLFHGDPAVVGRVLRDDGKPVTIVGVLPPNFRFPIVAWLPGKTPSTASPRPYDLIEPLVPGENELKDDQFDYNYLVIARLKPGVTVAQARVELDGLQKAHTLAARLPGHLGIAIHPFTEDITGGVSAALWLLFAAVGTVLLIACVNLANLQLARAVSREREVAVRSALGAGRLRLVQSRLAESLVLAVLGGAAGIVLSQLGVRLFVLLAPANLPRIHEVQIHWMVLAFAASLSIITALLFGTLPALHSLKVQPQQAMQSTTNRAANTRDGAASRNLLVTVEVACTLVLLIVTALVIRSFVRVLHQDWGFNAGHVTVADVVLLTPQYGNSLKTAPAARIAFIERTLARLRRLPGVQSAAMTSALPLTGDTWVDAIIRPEHPLPAEQEPQVNVRWVSPEYMSLMGIPIVAGRGLTEADKEHSHNVLISQKTARDAWPGEDPIGKQMRSIDKGRGTFTVVGVVGDARTNNLKEVADMVYKPFWNEAPGSVSFLVRSSLPANALAPSIRREIWQIDPEVSIRTLKSLDEQVSDSVALERFQSLLLSCFGVAALMLALLGVYGVLSYSVSLRAHEMGIRIALGADKANLVRLVISQAVFPVIGGLLIGLSAAIFAVRWVQSLLYETKLADPLAIASGILLLLLTAALAAILPARRAARVDPMRVLRME